MTTSAIKLLIADDHKIHLEGLVALLNQDQELDVIATATNGLEVISNLELHTADIVILDLNMPKKDGFWVLDQISIRWPNLKTLVMSSYSEPKIIEKAKLAGAKGYLLKTAGLVVLKNAIQVIHKGGEYFDKEALADQSLIKPNVELERNYDDSFLKKYSLSEREAQILMLMANSLSTEEIANQLHLSAHTVSTHRKNIKNKLNLKSIAEVIRFAFTNDLI